MDVHDLGPVDMASSLFAEIDDSAASLGQTSTFNNGDSHQDHNTSTIGGALAAKRSSTFG